ncbi:MAG: RNase adapter RapZ [Clostridia bacterium]|nr:RNase adapter RapZ [Clostridia bacterium]
MELILVTGLSGAGKSRVIDALEDIGYFCVDNMPPKLISTFVQLILSSKEPHERIAVVTDIRAGFSAQSFSDCTDDLQTAGIDYKVLFVTADDDSLQSRYKLTRRKHPLSDLCSGLLNDAITLERERMRPALQKADYVIDTSHLTPKDCRERVAALFMDNPAQKMHIHCMSFGFKYGMPTDADLVFDVRCLPNPFYVDELKEHNGLEECVSEYVLKWDTAQMLLAKLYDMLDFLIPLYEKEGKTQLVIAIGCSGGKHRSVVFAEKLHRHIQQNNLLTSIYHRDMNK